MVNQLPVIVVGAGLGGIAAALGLARGGRRVLILEQAAELGVIGYGIQLGPNVFPLFRKLGVEQQILAHAHFPSEVLMLDAITGERVIGVDTGPAFRERFKDPYIAIHRVDLHAVLLDACRALPNVEIRTSTSFVASEESEDRVTVRTGNGNAIDGCALIGADGLGSSVRRDLFGDEPTKPIGYVAHRTIVPMSSVPRGVGRDEVILWGGPGFHIVQYPLRNRSLFNIVAVFRTQNIYERADEETYRRVLLRSYAGAHPTMHSMLRMMNLERRWVIADRDPIRHWSKGLRTLLGDSAHPTLQSYAQGACMAIEDALVLAKRVEQEGDDFAAAFKAYEMDRYLRTARVVLESRALWEFYHLSGIEAEVRNATASGRTQDDVYRCLAWIYDGVENA